jgi:nucleotide-binding universal stress UspA family protein
MYPKNGVGPALPARAEELEADLLVMGRGRSPMRERIFGDVTWQFLDHHAIAMLIAH